MLREPHLHASPGANRKRHDDGAMPTAATSPRKRSDPRPTGSRQPGPPGRCSHPECCCSRLACQAASRRLASQRTHQSPSRAEAPSTQIRGRARQIRPPEAWICLLGGHPSHRWKLLCRCSRFILEEQRGRGMELDGSSLGEARSGQPGARCATGRAPRDGAGIH
jgi:hypothetical protein